MRVAQPPADAKKGEGFSKIAQIPHLALSKLHQLPASVVSCRRNGQEGNCGLPEDHSIGGRRGASDRRQPILWVQRQRAAVQPNLGIPQARRFQGVTQ
jgi:hypothetical protein